MSAVEIRTVITKRHEYAVGTPAVWADVREAMAFAKRDKEAAGLDTSYDDSIMVTADEETITVYWEEE